MADPTHRTRRRSSGPPLPTIEAARLGDPARASVLRDILFLADDKRDSMDDSDGDGDGGGEGAENALLRPSARDRFTHGFHTWPAAFHPDAAAAALTLLPEGPVADPFCGGGTTLVEAMILGRPAFGRDISEVAVRIARARTLLCSQELLTSFRSACRKAAEEARKNPLPSPEERRRVLGEWYEPHVLEELESLRRSTMKAPMDVRPLMQAVFSSILVKTSLRESDTSARRLDRKRPPGTSAVLFHKKARELARRLDALRESVPVGTPSADVLAGDAREFHTRQPLAAVLCSPPYPGVYDYLPMQTLRHVWFGVDPEKALNREMGSRRAFRKDGEAARAHWRVDTARWLARCFGALQSIGGLLVLLGDGRAGDRVLGVSEPLRLLAGEVGFRLVAGASVLRPEPGWGPGRLEHAFLFEKPLP